jgi:uncharacterized membrane protein required for colicin V production
MSTTFNLFDLIFITFTFIFVVTAFIRGFIKEMFSLLAWVVALLVSYFGAPFLAKFLSSYSDNKMVLAVISRAILFILTFVILLFSTSGLSDGIKDKMPKLLDRSLGVLYGIGKTILIFSVIYSVTINLYSLLLGKQQDPDASKVPQWLSEAKCGNILKISGEIIDPAVRAFMSGVTKNLNKSPKTLDDKIDEVVDEVDVDVKAKNKTNSKTSDSSKTSNPEEDLNDEIERETGYNKRDIEKMNRLIEVIGK